MPAEPAPDPFLRLIAIFKLVKASLCVSIGLGLLHYLNKDVEMKLVHVMNSLHVDSDNHIPKVVLEEAGKLTNTKIETLSAVAFFYGALFAMEGTGL